mmetsp:Transcript_12623/g.33091  ORF Transcript_12623/g.33091 Transcript_12623/m.33091 type:complete len:127 (+) Transcript_12623:52-432(+)
MGGHVGRKSLRLSAPPGLGHGFSHSLERHSYIMVPPLVCPSAIIYIHPCARPHILLFSCASRAPMPIFSHNVLTHGSPPMPSFSRRGRGYRTPSVGTDAEDALRYSPLFCDPAFCGSCCGSSPSNN